jgi:hypothetical protein
MKNICLFACTHQTSSLITQVRMSVGSIVCHGCLIDTSTFNFVHLGRHLVAAGRDIKSSFNGMNLYSKNHRGDFMRPLNKKSLNKGGHMYDADCIL